MIPYFPIATVGLILFILIIGRISRRRPPTQWYPPPSPSDIAGIEGERYARNRIRKILRPNDQLFSNVAVSYDGREAELDNVIVNPFGVFIVEVKNYSGTLAGDADDFEWEKLHMSQGGNIYIKTVKNPIRQVKRQIYILAKYLDYYGVRTWVEGYVYMCDAESPVEDEHILSSLEDLDRKIHTASEGGLPQRKIDEITKLLS